MNSCSSCLYLLNAEITGRYHYAQPENWASYVVGDDLDLLTLLFYLLSAKPLHLPFLCFVCREVEAGSHYVFQADLELSKILLSLSPQVLGL